MLNPTLRWGLVGFVGTGKTASSAGDLSDGPFRNAGGVAFRYLMAGQYGLHTGVDIARVPEETAVYLTMGKAWR